MASNSEFQVVEVGGWLSGLPNLLRADFGKWFHTRRWWVQSLMWTAIINGIVYFAASNNPTPPGLTDRLMMYALFTGLFSIISVIIMMQGVIVGEREAGTAAWVLSKPVTRVAFIVSKLLPNLVGVLVSMVLAPGLVAYAQFSSFAGAPLNQLHFAAGLGILWIFIGYYLALTLMLGTFFNRRGPVIGIAMAWGLGQQMFIALPILQRVLPWALAIPANEQNLPTAVEVFLGQPISDPLPLIVTSGCLLIFVAVGIWRFNQEEFQ